MDELVPGEAVVDEGLDDVVAWLGLGEAGVDEFCGEAGRVVSM